MPVRIVKTYGEDKGLVTFEYEGQVASFEHIQVRVSSDHAFIDSGNRLRVVVWDGTEIHEVGYHTDSDITATADITDEERADMEAYRAVCSWFVETQNRYFATLEPVSVFRSRNFGFVSNIKRGDFVDVVRGRKVPKGRYEVTNVDEGQYGPYVDLRSLWGKSYRFVNPGNLERPEPTPEIIRDCVKKGEPETVVSLAAAALANKNNFGQLLLVVDTYLDIGDENKARHLRRLIEKKLASAEPFPVGNR